MDRVINAKLVPKYRYDGNGGRTVRGYQVEFYDKLRSPKRKRLSLKTTEERVAQRRMNSLETSVDRGEFDPWIDTIPDTRALCLQDAISRFVESRRDKECSAATIETYEYVLGSFAASLAPDFPLHAVEERHVDAFLAQDLAEQTRKSYRARLRVLFRWFVDEGLLRSNPVSEYAGTKKARAETLPSYFTEEQFRALVSSVRSDGSAKGLSVDWFLDAVEFAVNTGLRRGELTNMRWKSVNRTSFTGGDGRQSKVRTVRVEAGPSFTPKSGRPRTVPLNGMAASIIERLEQHRTNEDDMDHVFKGARRGQIYAPYLSSRFRFYRRMARLPETLNFHSLRHSFGTWCVQNGMDLYRLKEIMGHATVQQTSVYAKLATSDLARAVVNIEFLY